MNLVFNIVYWMLQWWSRITGLSYEAVNIIAYYFCVPLVFFFLIDRIIRKHYFVFGFLAAWALFLFFVPNFDNFADDAFERSVAFLNAFAAIGWNYTVASVLICVVGPGITFVVLLYYAFPKLFQQRILFGRRPAAPSPHERV